MITEIERKTLALNLFKKLEKTMINLYSRWLDESEYEDINDYSINLKNEVEKINGKFLKMYKKPFGFTFQLSNATYQIMIKSSQYQYKRIA